MSKANANKIQDKEKENQMKLAKKWAKAISKLPEMGLNILWRTTGEFAGVGVIERRAEDGTYRTLIRYIRPDGRMAEEYLDYKPDPYDDPVETIPLVMSKPLIITARKKPGFENSEDNFEWIMDMRRANYYIGLKDDLIKRNNEISELMWRLDEQNITIKRQQKEIDVLEERARMLEDKLEMVSRENILLHSTIAQLEEIAKKSLAGYVEAETALNEVMRKAGALGQERVMSYRDRVKQIAEEGKEIMELIQSTYGTGIDETPLINKMNDLLNRIGRLEQEVKSLRRSESIERVEKEATV